MSNFGEPPAPTSVTFWTRPAECYRHNCGTDPAWTLEWLAYKERRYDKACDEHAHVARDWANLRGLGVLKRE